jgi:large subunit ribosomal protein L31
MKDGIHPKYEKCVVVCACGYTFETRSTSPTIHLDVCSQCHPYYTGRQRIMDTGGRVERFRRRYNKSDAATAAAAATAPPQA